MHTQSMLTTASWTPTHVDTTYDRLVSHQLRLALLGVKSTVVIGPPGVGKTAAVEAAVRAHDERELARLEADGDGEPRVCVRWVRASDAQGKKTGLIDVYGKIVARPTTRTRHAFTPAELIELLALECQQRNVRALVIDEAQKIVPMNLDQIRQIPDAAKADGHPMGVLLIGTPALRALVVQTGQLGQRYTGLVEMHPLSKGEMVQALPKLHPQLEALRQEIGEPAWRAFAEDFARVANGSWRRAHAMVANAHELAVKHQTTLTLDHLEVCLDKIAPEI